MNPGLAIQLLKKKGFNIDTSSTRASSTSVETLLASFPAKFSPSDLPLRLVVAMSLLI
jgi:hypothetical protein